MHTRVLDASPRRTFVMKCTNTGAQSCTLFILHIRTRGTLHFVSHTGLLIPSCFVSKLEPFHNHPSCVYVPARRATSAHARHAYAQAIAR